MTDPIQLLIDAGAIPNTPFDAQSRYNGVPLALLEDPATGRTSVYVRRRFIRPTTATAGQHRVNALDRPDMLGAKYFGDALLYWRIADANAVIDPNELTDTLGQRITIPLVNGT